MIHIFYPLGTGSRWDNNELRLSISSVRKNCTDKNISIHVCGCMPPDDIPDINYISAPKISTSRFQIVAYNLLMAFNEVKPEKAVIMNDDFFCLRPFSFEEMPLYYDMTIEERANKPGISYAYRQNLMNSISSVDDLNFAVHFPMPVFHTEDFKAVLTEARYKERLSFRNVYGNIRRKAGDKIEQRPDIKFTYPMSMIQFITEMQGQNWFSINDYFLSPSNKSLLKNLLS